MVPKDVALAVDEAHAWRERRGEEGPDYSKVSTTGDKKCRKCCLVTPDK